MHLCLYVWYDTLRQTICPQYFRHPRMNHSKTFFFVCAPSCPESLSSVVRRWHFRLKYRFPRKSYLTPKILMNKIIKLTLHVEPYVLCVEPHVPADRYNLIHTYDLLLHCFIIDNVVCVCVYVTFAGLLAAARIGLSTCVRTYLSCVTQKR